MTRKVEGLALLAPVEVARPAAGRRADRRRAHNARAAVTALRQPPCLPHLEFHLSEHSLLRSGQNRPTLCARPPARPPPPAGWAFWKVVALQPLVKMPTGTTQRAPVRAAPWLGPDLPVASRDPGLRQKVSQAGPRVAQRFGPRGAS